MDLNQVAEYIKTCPESELSAINDFMSDRLDEIFGATETVVEETVEEAPATEPSEEEVSETKIPASF